MNKLYLTLLLIIQLNFSFAQQETGIFGKIIDAKTQNALSSVVVTVQNTNFTEITNAEGLFRFNSLPGGSHLILIHSQGFKDALYPVDLLEGQMLDLGTIALDEDQSIEQQGSLIALTESDFSDDSSGSENTSGLLQSSKDAFQQAAAFNWGQARFRIRGLDSEHSTMMINGVSMNKLYDGRPQWGDWGGLNDATRNQEFSVGTSP
ncbi:MAG TPA: carboxypeptidase-like regulatory domain-containing protein, partial [Flavobacterium sp.]